MEHPWHHRAPMSAPSPHAPAAEPTHGCVRCGAPIPISESMCERCNPLGLKAPAASQAHGIAIVGVGVAVVVLAVLARVAIADVGPFTGSVASMQPDTDGVRVSISVHNAGSSAGTTTCRLDDPSRGGIGPQTVYVQSPSVPGGESVTFDVVVGTLGASPAKIVADCGA
jgi:predicted nucleic acid-binding Zn ribbon protein